MAFETQDIAALSINQAMAFTTDQMAAMSTTQLDTLIISTPIVLDLNGDGIQTVSASRGTHFDLNATGSNALHGWVSPQDGLLVLDRNHDGVINDGTELFGTATILSNGQRAGNGYNALLELDTNHDGKITAADAQFKDLKVWVDANGDGISQPGRTQGPGQPGHHRAGPQRARQHGAQPGQCARPRLQLQDQRWRQPRHGRCVVQQGPEHGRKRCRDSDPSHVHHTGCQPRGAACSSQRIGQCVSPSIDTCIGRCKWHGIRPQFSHMSISAADVLSDRGSDLLAGHDISIRPDIQRHDGGFAYSSPICANRSHTAHG
ncbi:MAG: hypothetical protein QM749_16330 [Aquabacterium sp.]